MKKPLYKIILFVVIVILSFSQLVLAKKAEHETEINDHIHKAIALYTERNYVEAIDLFQQAYLLDSKNASVLYYIAKAYDNLGNYENARYYYNKTIEMDPKHTPSIYNLGIIDFNEGKIDNAEDNFKKAIKSDDKLAYAYYNLGNIYFSKDQYQAAIENYSQAIKINSKMYNSLFNIALIYQKTNQPKLALKYMEKYLDKVPKDEDATKLIKVLKDSSKG